MKRLGWRPDTPDFRDFIYAAPLGQTLVPTVDLRPFAPPIVDQSVSNSCVGNSSASMVRFVRRKLGLPDFQPSRLFIYYFARRLQGWQDADEGATIRDAMKVLEADGVCDEADWPFDIDKVNDRPDQMDLHRALENRQLKYVRMRRGDDLYHLKHSLQLGIPFMLGISVYSSFFDTGDDGLVRMPRSTETLEGGHAMYVVGYDNNAGRFIVANSWGDWGDKGYCYLPYAYLLNDDLSDDFWALQH